MKIRVTSAYEYSRHIVTGQIVRGNQCGWLIMQGDDVLAFFPEWLHAYAAACGIADGFADADRANLKEMGILV